MKETGYEKIPHAVFMFSHKKSIDYDCFASAEIAMEQMIRNSDFVPSVFEVKKINEGITIMNKYTDSISKRVYLMTDKQILWLHTIIVRAMTKRGLQQ